MSRLLVSTGLIVATAMLATGCPPRHSDRETVYVEEPRREKVVVVQEPPPQRVVVVEEPPPRLIVEQRPPPPSTVHVWIGGYWAHGGSGYVWVSGRWQAPPHPHDRWEEPRWERDHDHYRFHEGHWH